MNRRSLLTAAAVAPFAGCGAAHAASLPTPQEAFATLCQAIDREAKENGATGWDAYVVRTKSKPPKFCLSYHGAGPDCSRLDVDLTA